MIPYKPEQSAMPSHHLSIDAYHGRFHLSHPWMGSPQPHLNILAIFAPNS
jgi:hypothetical protein